MDKNEILDNLERLKKETLKLVDIENCCMRVMYSCDYCLNEINEECIMQMDIDCIEKNFNELKRLIEEII
jgi:hypothetical protein